VAVDVPGARRIMAVGEKMKGKLSLAVGFQIRYASPYVLLERRIREGQQIGPLVSGQIYYFASSINRPPFADKPADERRLRNWIYEKTISGDIIVEQNIHIIDVTNWLLNGRPLKAYGKNGRAGRTDDGDCSSHYNCVFTYPKDVHISFSSTQFGRAAWGVGMQYSGTRGVAEARYDAPVRISGETSWEAPGLGRPQAVDQQAAVTGRFSGALDDADANKQAAFIGSILTGNLQNEAVSGTESTLAAMLGRMAAETGREVTWEELLKSTEVYDPKINFAQFV
jgi:predicted dehydrogenase